MTTESQKQYNNTIMSPVPIIECSPSRSIHQHSYLISTNEYKMKSPHPTTQKTFLHESMALVWEPYCKSMLTKQKYSNWLTSFNVSNVAKEMWLRGTVPEIDQKNMTFQIHQMHGPQVTCPLLKQHQKTIVNAFNGYIDNTMILVRGTSFYNQQDAIVNIQSIEDITILHPLDVPSRLDEFRDMQDGWLEGDGLAPSHTGLDWLAEIFQRFYPDDLPLPHTYPTPDGGIQMEWSHGENSVILEINLQSHIAESFSFNRYSNKDEISERVLNLDFHDHWRQLGNEIKNRL